MFKIVNKIIKSAINFLREYVSNLKAIAYKEQAKMKY